MAKRVLVADDELVVRELVRGVLQRAGFEVTTAPDGPACLREVAMQRPHLLVLDVVMPGLDGLQVLQALRQRPDTRDLPVIMLTSLADDLDVLRGWLKGVDCYLTKPFDPAVLTLVARRMLEDEAEDQDSDCEELGGDGNRRAVS